jgi:peptidoglycan/xylan/chitin deacetylase (PgdA/CDA1 family)
MNLQFSFDDGSPYDFQIIEILKRYNYTATFYIPIESPMFDKIDKYLNAGMIIGAHTVTHPVDLKRLSEEEQNQEISQSKEILEREYEIKVDSFCYPRGRYNECTKALVQRAGFKEARTTIVLKTDLDFDPFCKPTTVHVFSGRKEYNGKNWETVAHEILDTQPEYFHLWGHSKEIEAYKQWINFEVILKRLYDEGRVT